MFNKKKIELLKYKVERLEEENMRLAHKLGKLEDSVEVLDAKVVEIMRKIEEVRNEH